MELAICFGGLDTPEATAQKLLENGAHIIETMWGFFSDSDDDKIGNTARIFKDKGIFIRSVHAPFGGNYNLASTDDEQREKALQANLDLLRKLSKIGVEMIVVHPGLGGDNWQNEKPDEFAYCLFSIGVAFGRVHADKFWCGRPGRSPHYIPGRISNAQYSATGECNPRALFCY